MRYTGCSPTSAIGQKQSLNWISNSHRAMEKRRKYNYRWTLKYRKYPSLDSSYRLLKQQTHAISLLQQWRLMRSIAGREHLHLTRYFSRCGISMVRPNYGPILRRRRLHIARSFARMGYAVHPVLLSYALPKGPSGFWLDQLCPWEGPAPLRNLP